MSNAVVRCLEALGQNPSVLLMSGQDYASWLEGLGLSATQHEAMLQRDQLKLNKLVGAREVMVCAVFAPEDQPFKEGEDEETKEDGEDDPDKDTSIN